MGQVRVKFLRPLNGDPVGTEGTYDQADADRLEASGAVKILGAAKAAVASPETKMEAAPANKATAIKTTKGK